MLGLQKGETLLRGPQKPATSPGSRRTLPVKMIEFRIRLMALHAAGAVTAGWEVPEQDRTRHRECTAECGRGLR